MVKCISDIEKSKMERLVEFLNYHTKLYNEDKEKISDKEWDKSYFELQALENSTGYILPDSPTQKIKYEVVNELKKIPHNHPMLSADKTKDWDAFVSYFGEKDVLGMLKMDGLTLSLRYVDGRLVSAETRGNGFEGEDVLHNAKVIPSIPKVIDCEEELIIDGEIICTYKNFEKFADEYSNPRNFASGSIRLLDAKECSRRNLTFIAWNVVKGLEDNIMRNLDTLSDLGFTIVPYTSSFDWDAKDFLIDTAKELGYPIDGLVGRFTSREYGESLGSTSHHSRALYAFKFHDEEYETELLDLEFSLGRTGQLTPVAVFVPVDDGVSVIERASLHNISVLGSVLGKYPFVGQKIRVAKMNEIIPQVVWAEDSSKAPSEDKELLKLLSCPVCGGGLEITDNNGVIVAWCGNPNCEGKITKKIEHFCSKDKGMDIRGLSLKTIEKLTDKGWLINIKDLYTLKSHKSEWIEMSGFGDKSVSNILNAIENSRTCEWHNFISALGIPLIGRTVSKEIGKLFNSYQEFRDFVDTDDTYFDEFDGFGEEMNNALKNFDYEEADFIAKNYLNFAETSVQDTQSKAAAGLIFVITGKLSAPRSQIQAKIEAAGAKMGSSVSSKTNYLVCNAEENSTKYRAAIEKNIPIITEEELMEMLK